jgi:protein pelota
LQLGQYHTLELEMNRSFSIAKQFWDPVYLERVKMACEPEQTAEIAAIVAQQGLAHLCLVLPHMTLTKQKIEVPVPKKQVGSSNHDKVSS